MSDNIGAGIALKFARICLVLGVCLSMTFARGETIKLKNGKEVTGDILSITPTSVIILVSNSRLTLAKDLVILPDLPAYLSQAEKELQSGEFGHAGELVRSVLTWDPGNPKAKELQVKINAAATASLEAKPKPSAEGKPTTGSGERAAPKAAMTAPRPGGEQLEITTATKEAARGNLSQPQPTIITDKAGDRLEFLGFDPPPPVTLKAHQPLNVKISYALVSAEECAISVRPIVGGMMVDGEKPNWAKDLKKGSGEATVGFSMPAWDGDESIEQVSIWMEPLQKTPENQPPVVNFEKILRLQIDAGVKWTAESLNLTIPAATAIEARPIPARQGVAVASPEGATGLEMPKGFIFRQSKKFLDEKMALEVAKLAFIGKTGDHGEAEIHAKAGAEFTIGVTATYKVGASTKLAANLKPDVRVATKQLQPENRMNLYNTTVHFDTGSRPNYSPVKGDGAIDFTLTSWAPADAGRHEKILTVGLFEEVGGASLVQKHYPLTLIVEKPETVFPLTAPTDKPTSAGIPATPAANPPPFGSFPTTATVAVPTMPIVAPTSPTAAR